MRYGSVCSGIEAATVAWHPLGWRPAWFAEIEPFPSAVLAHHYPTIPNLGDMTRIARDVLLGQVEAPGALVGGTPCQAFSVAGLRAGLEDERGQLVISYVRLADAIDHVRQRAGQPPAVIVWENVPGVLSSRDNAFGCFLGALAGEDGELQPAGPRWSDAGCVYGPQRTIAWRVFDAQYFGLAQRRRRVFLVASARTGLDPAAVLFESDSLRRDTPPRRITAQDIAGAFARSVALRGRDGGGTAELGDDVGGTLRASSGGGDKPYVLVGGPEMNRSHSHLAPMAFGGNNQSGPIEVATARNACGSGSGRLDFETETFIVNPVCVTGDITHTLKAEGFDASEDGTGRGQPIVAFHGAQDPDSSGDVTHPVGRNQGRETCALIGRHVRRLTPRECERLQGFPDHYTLTPYRGKPAADGPRYKAIGNGMAVPVMRWIGRRLDLAIKRAAA